MAVACPCGGHLTAILKAERSGGPGMAKRHGKRRRRFGRYIRGSIDETTSFLNLNTRVLTTAIFDSVVNERTFVSSVVSTYALSEFTLVQGSGPIVVGIAHSDYSITELTEWLTQTGGWNETDLVAQEIGKRKIKLVGTFESPALVTEVVRLNDGKQIRTKCGWILNQGQSLQLWVFNSGDTSVGSGSTPVVRMQGHANLWPR